MNEPNEPKHEYLDDTLANQQPSKSARKREANATLDIARQLVDMSDKLFNTLHLDPDIRNAAALAKNIRTHGGKKRQIQYLAKLMRQSNVADIQRQLDAIAARAHTSKREHHRLEFNGGTGSLSTATMVSATSCNTNPRRIGKNFAS